jgi:hypothetical protein
MIVSFGPHFFESIGGAGVGGPTKVSVCEKALLVASINTTRKLKIGLQSIFIKLKYDNIDNDFKTNAVWES